MGIFLAIVGIGAALAVVHGMMSAVRHDPFAERLERNSGERLLGLPTVTAPVRTAIVHDEAWALLAPAKKPAGEDLVQGPAPAVVVAAVDPAPTRADSPL